ncbi:unnamed protein product [Blepharisma stoltei]|uniref:Protein kinase domain-containing protein n=1 Tax=Blepharisma stoltei TaxID=1481888 RepID=A0AAU9JDM3_9CILI|nr:unnamed protein product [Blepharisma stoltei]
MYTCRELYIPHEFDQSAYRDASVDDSFEDHYQWEVGFIIKGKYIINRYLGEGSFGRVLEVRDLCDKKIKAMKIIKQVPEYVNEAKTEVETLKMLNSLDIDHNSHIVEILDAFPFENHYCIVFEKLGRSLFSLIERNSFRGFTVNEIKDFSRQILESLNFMHKHQLTHTDLKPENILLVNDQYKYCPQRKLYRPASTDVKIIDFGGATFVNDHHSTTISTRHYRAPEVILQSGWSMSSDMWSLGCILIELYTGKMLFPLLDDYAHLALMEKLFGRFPTKMIKASGKKLKVYFNKRNQLNWPELCGNSSDFETVENAASIEELIPDIDFRNFVTDILRFNPEWRPTPSEALMHRFLANDL